MVKCCELQGEEKGVFLLPHAPWVCYDHLTYRINHTLFIQVHFTMIFHIGCTIILTSWEHGTTLTPSGASKSSQSYQVKAWSTKRACAQLLLKTLWLYLVKKASKLGHILLFSLHRNKPFLTSIFTLLNVENIKENMLCICKKISSTRKISPEGCDQKGKFTAGLPFVCRSYIFVFARFLGLKWQRLRDSFSKLMLLPFRHTFPGGVKLEIQGGFWGWGAQRRCGEQCKVRSFNQDRTHLPLTGFENWLQMHEMGQQKQEMKLMSEVVFIWQ